MGMGMGMVAHWHQRFTMQRHIDDTGHLMGWTVRPCPLVSPLMPFVYRVKGRLMKLDRERYSWGAVGIVYWFRASADSWPVESLRMINSLEMHSSKRKRKK